MLCQKIPQGEDVRLAEKILCKALPDWEAEKKPYSQVWKYRDDIRKMHKLQEQYLFLVRHKIESAEELVSVLDNLTDKKKKHQRKRVRPIRQRKDLKIFLTRLNRFGSLMMRNRVIRVGIPSLKMSTMHGKGLTLNF